MSSQKLIIAVIFLTVSNVFLLIAAAEESLIGDNLNCLSVKSKYRPFKGQNALWKHTFEKAFTDQEIEITKCANEGDVCFAGVFSYGSHVKGVCKTQTIAMAMEIYRSDTGEKEPIKVNNVPVGCNCHLQVDQFSTYK